MTDPQNRSFWLAFERSADTRLKHGNAFSAVRAGMVEIVGPSVEFLAWNIIPESVFPCAEIHLSQVFVDRDWLGEMLRKVVRK